MLVTLGTDHHRFDRLVSWVTSWSEQTEHAVQIVIQEGATPAPASWDSVGIVSRDRLLDLIDEATVVVSQAGPGSISDINRRGRVPIVVARLADLDEVVDDHQVGFASRMDAAGRARRVATELELASELERVLDDPAQLRIPPIDAPDPRVRERFAEVLADVSRRRPGVVRWRRVRSTLLVRTRR